MSDNREGFVPDEGLEKDPGSVADEEPTASTEYLEFVGSPEYGTEFYGRSGTHTVTRKDLKDAANVDLGTKEAVWKRGADGRFLVPVSDLSPEAAEYLANDPMFKRVTI